VNPRNDETLLQQDDGEPWGCVNHPTLYGYGTGHLCWQCHEAQPGPVTRPHLRSLDPATPEWEKDLLTGTPEPRVWNDPIEVALREYGERKPQTYRGGRR